MNIILGFVVIILTIINFCIYHKYVTTFYFDLPTGCVTELCWIGLGTMIEMAIVILIIKKIFSVIGAFLGFVGKLILIVIIAAIVIFVVWKIVQIILSKSGKNKDAGTGSTADFTKKAQDMFTRKTTDANMNICPGCGKPIGNGVKFCRFCGKQVENNG